MFIYIYIHIFINIYIYVYNFFCQSHGSDSNRIPSYWDKSLLITYLSVLTELIQRKPSTRSGASFYGTHKILYILIFTQLHNFMEVTIE